jgi:hypothetical protein
MNDESLAVFLNLNDEEAAKFFPKLTAEKRAVYEHMASVVADLNMGVVPDGVMVCRPKCGGRYER